MNFIKKHQKVILIVLAIAAVLYFVVPMVTENFDANPAPVCVLFHWKDCGHCKTMMPEWDTLKEMGDDGKLGKTKIEKIEQAEMKTKAPEHKDVQGYPTIKYCPNGVKDAASCKVFSGDRSAEALKTFILKQKK